MPYQMDPILSKCALEDYEVLVETMQSWFRLIDGDKLRQELAEFRADPSREHQLVLNRHLETCIRYFGSSDLAYFARWICSDRETPGVELDEVIGDVSDRLGVKQKVFGSTEAKLERLVMAVAERTFFALSPKDQRELFTRAGIAGDQQRQFFEKLKENKALFMPVLLSILGPKLLAELLSNLAVAALSSYLPKKAAQELIKQAATKAPWLAWLGPVVWALSLSWLALDLQGPAYRKTVPALLYLGIVCLRDGPSDAEGFVSEADEG